MRVGKGFLVRLTGPSGRVILAQALGQSAQLLALPIIARHYGPSLMGVYQVGLATALVLVPVATLRVEYVLPLVSEMGVRKNVLKALLASLALASALIGIALWFWVTGELRASKSTFLALAIMLGTAVNIVDNSFLVRWGDYRALALRNLYAGLFSAGSQILCATLGFDITIVGVAFLLSRIAAVLLVRGTPVAAYENRDETSEDSSRRRVVSGVASGILSNASIYAPSFILGGAYGANAAGQLGVAQRLAGSPLTMAGRGISQVVQSKLVGAIREDRHITPLMLRVLRPIAAGAFAVFVVLAVGGPLCVPAILGAEWKQAGYMVAVLAVPLSGQLVMNPLSTVLLLLGREHLAFSLQAMRLGLILAFAGIFTLLGASVLMTTVGIMIAWSIAYGMQAFIILRLCKYRDRNSSVQVSGVLDTT